MEGSSKEASVTKEIEGEKRERERVRGKGKKREKKKKGITHHHTPPPTTTIHPRQQLAPTNPLTPRHSCHILLSHHHPEHTILPGTVLCHTPPSTRPDQTRPDQPHLRRPGRPKYAGQV
jgi:hypothetical protein